MPNQLLNALYNAMPQHWHDCFLNAGIMMDTTVLPKIQQYICIQECNVDKQTQVNKALGCNSNCICMTNNATNK